MLSVPAVNRFESRGCCWVHVCFDCLPDVVEIFDSRGFPVNVSLTAVVNFSIIYANTSLFMKHASNSEIDKVAIFDSLFSAYKLYQGRSTAHFGSSSQDMRGV